MIVKIKLEASLALIKLVFLLSVRSRIYPERGTSNTRKY